MKKSVLPLIGLFLVTVIFISAIGCSQEGSETQLTKEIYKITEGDLKVPLFDEYPILHAIVHKLPELLKNGPISVSIYYGLEKGDLKETFQDKSSTDDHLYGPYEGRICVIMEYSFSKPGFSGFDEAGKWKINDKELEIYYLYRANKTIHVPLDLKKGRISIMYILGDEFTEEDAKKFTESVLKQIA